MGAAGDLDGSDPRTRRWTELRRFDSTTRRLIALGGGLLLGVVGAVLAKNVQLGVSVQNAFFSEPRNLEPVYFGALFAIMAGWLSATVRDRKGADSASVPPSC